MKWITCIFSLLLFQACLPKKVEKRFTIEGELVEAGTGRPLDGVVVFVYEEPLSNMWAISEHGIFEEDTSNASGMYKIETKTEASGKLNISFYYLLRSEGCEYRPGIIFDAGNEYKMDFVLISQNYVEFNYDNLKTIEIDSLVFNVANNNLLTKFTEIRNYARCNFCYPVTQQNTLLPLPLADKYCFEKTPVPLQRSYRGARAVNSFYEQYAYTTVLSNFDNTISIKAYNNGKEVYNKSVEYNFKSSDKAEQINF